MENRIEVCFAWGTNLKTQQPQLKMEIEKDGFKTIYTPDRSSTIKAKPGTWYQAIPGYVITSSDKFEVVAVKVEKEISKSAVLVDGPPVDPSLKQKILNPAFADDFKGPKPEKTATQKRVKAKVIFQETEQGTAAIAHIEGATVMLTPKISNTQPKAEERWEVEFGRARLLNADEKTWSAECNLVRRLPDLGTYHSSRSGLKSEPLIVGVIPEGVTPDLDLEVVRGINTTTGREQWQARVQDALGNQTLYVVDRFESPILPTLNGQRFGVLVGKQIHPKADAEDAETASFKIKLVSLIQYYEPEEKVIVFSAPPPPSRSKERAELHERQPKKGKSDKIDPSKANREKKQRIGR